ncbi:AbrB family transcriptional regulator [Oceanobacillus caeni]|uniref:AbrB family transcriptional regulator n=1 Tax=Oceanobacillus caeni TaxID=405946 RepID=UPI0036271A8C
MMEGKSVFRFVGFVIISGIGGFLLSLTGLSIGWMIGTLLTATLLSIFYPKLLQVSAPHKQKGLPKIWLHVGQLILGIELGRKMNSSVLYIFGENWLTIIVMLILSIVFALLSGFIVWKYTNLDMLTGFFATAPGGLSSIPSIAEEVGANTGIVSIVQTMRIFLVVLTIPVVLSMSFVNHTSSVASHPVPTATPPFEAQQMLWTVVFILIAWLGYYLGKFLKFPAPWLLGSMVSVAAVKSFGSIIIGHDLIFWWPHVLMILSQVFIGASIGSRFHKNMFSGLKRTLVVSLLGTIGLIISMFTCSYIVSLLTGISFITSALAFAPGGIAEMTTTAIVLDADSTFVVAVQVLRIIAVCIILPPLFRWLNYWEMKKGAYTHESA